MSTETEEARLRREIEERQAQLNEIKGQPYPNVEAAADAARTDPNEFNERMDALKAVGRPLYVKEEA
jgi:hypothetical protein